ncbi:MAG: ABC transporter [Chloroflexi bacterium RBG_19FT_COMBO_49_13]|nr:MAG: ABC transporter [Chloroflexi bacterium RBG_16_47_49]OGO61886.1 MAG: ABC transporter [Chloroflexi bacterium RBG_19FT_COMBO_49_13]
MTFLVVKPEYDLKKAISDNRLAGLWRMMTGFRLAYLGANTSLALAATSKTATYLLLRYFVDEVLGKSNGRAIAIVALGFIGLALIEGTFTFLSGRLAAQTAEGIALRLRNFLYDHIQRLSLLYHDKTQTGELIQRSTSDVDALRRFFSEQAIGVGRILLLFLINLIAILRLNWQLGLASIIVVPPVVLISLLFFRRVSKAYEAYQEQEATLSTTLQENLTGVRVVKAFARQPYERDKFDKENWEKFKRGRRLLIMHSFFWPISDILCGFQMLAGFYIGARMAILGTISAGTYLAYAGLVVWLIWPMRNLGRLIVQTSTGLVSYGRVLEVIKQDREPIDEGDYLPSDDLHGEIVFRQVCFEYDIDSPVLKDINLICKPGQAIALLGSTGSGKTSLVNLLPRFYEYTSGSLTLDGVNLNRYPRRYLRQQIGIVEQEPFLFSRTIRENITYGVGRNVSKEEVEAAAYAAAIHDVIMSFPEGYDTLVGEKGVTLSGGQKQRVAIARTLLKNPRILILDDATSSVDMETEAEIRAALERLMVGRTSFIIAHRIQSVMNADLIAVLDQGQIVQQGTHEDLFAEGGIYRQVFDLQTRIEDELQQEIGITAV